MNDIGIGIREIPDFNITCVTDKGENIELNIHTASTFLIEQKYERLTYTLTGCVFPQTFWTKVVPEYNKKNISYFHIKTNTLARQEDGSDVEFSFPEVKFKYMNYSHCIKDVIGTTSITFFDYLEDI